MIPFHKEIDFTVFYREHVVRKQSLADSADVMDEIKNLLFKGYARNNFLSHKICALCSKNVKC